MQNKFDGIILASASPRRKKLMEKMNLQFSVIPSRLSEMPVMGDLANSYASRMAMEKAEKVAATHPNHIVIGADTVVSIGDNILGKPKSTQEASLMLSSLSGQWHDVWTGLCIICKRDEILIMKAIQSKVHFRDVSIDEIEDYVKTGEPMDKAGSYAIQGKARAFVKEIKGSYDNIVGLPTIELGKILYKIGATNDSNSIEASF